MAIDPVISRWFYRAFEFLGLTQVLTTNTTTAGTAANTTETDLWAYTMPAATLDANGEGVRITVFGTTANNTNSKTVRVYFGATAFTVLSTTSAAVSWRAVIEVIRTGATAQVGTGMSLAGGAIAMTTPVLTPSDDTAAAIVLKVTGQNGTSAANDIVFRGATVELIRPTRG